MSEVIGLSVAVSDEEKINWLRIVDSVIVRGGEVTSPIYIQRVSPAGKRLDEAFLLGTGFFVRHRGQVFFLTAAHVFDGADLTLPVSGSYKGKAFLFNGLPFSICRDNDIALAVLPQEHLEKYAIEVSDAVVFGPPPEGFLPLEHWVTMGYPVTRNGLNPKLAKMAINLNGTSFSERIEIPQAKAHIANPIGFRFDKKTAIDTQLKRQNPPKFSGTSGSPVFQIYGCYRAGVLAVAIGFEGVLLGWHLKEREVIAARAEAVEQMIEAFFFTLGQVLAESEQVGEFADG